MSLKKNPMPEQAPALRNKNFSEVALGYTPEAAVDEARRCLQCKNKPCVAGCPVEVKIPEFLAKIVEGDFEAAYQLIYGTNTLPAVCGRVCPQETQCEKVCVRGIKGESVAIGRLERFAADWHNNIGRDVHIAPLTPDTSNPDERGAEDAAPVGRAAPGAPSHDAALPLKISIVGSGPAGLSCAGALIASGCDVTVYEALHRPGGVLVYGIPEFRLPKDIVDKEVAQLKAQGVKFVCNAVIGKALGVSELFDDGCEAVFIGSGAGLPRFLGVPGEDFIGVYSANEYLSRVNLMRANLPEFDTPLKPAGRVCVVGGGNVAMDAARCALRVGAESVTIVYRRSMDELPARAEEIHHAMEEGIIFRLLTNPVAVLGDEQGRVRGMECVEMELGEPDDSGRRRPIEKKGSNVVVPCDTVIAAIGTDPNPLLHNATPALEVNRWGCLKVDDRMETTYAHVYAGGDAVTGAATVIEAMGAGKKAARSILEQLGI